MQKQTTVTIDQKTFATLDRLAKSNDVSKKEFLSCALEYFEKYGINPVQHESPAKEMQKLIKRCDQVIAFIRKQEQDILRPACAAISTTEARIERVLDKLATAGQVRDLQKAVSDQQQRFRPAATAELRCEELAQRHTPAFGQSHRAGTESVHVSWQAR